MRQPWAAIAYLTGCVAVVALLSVSAWGQTAQKQTSRKHTVFEESPVATAEAAIEKHDLSTAEKLLRQAVSESPNDYRAWFDLGFVLNAQGNTPEATDAYRKSVAAKPDLFESNLNLGLLLAKSGNPEAERYLKAATGLKPESRQNQGLARAWLALGHVLETNNPKGALEAFKAATTFEPKDPEPHVSAGILLEKQRQFASAEDEYKLALALDPKSSQAIAGLINVYTQSGRLPEAETALRQYTALDPQNAKAHTQLGRVLASQGKNDEAVAELQAALRLAPGDPVAVRELASLLIDSKKSGEAEALLRPLVQTSPGDASLHHQLGRALLYEGKPQGAQTEFLNAVKLNPKLGEAYGDLALAANQNQNYGLVVQALEARSSLLEDNPATYFLRATAYDHLRDVKQAAAYYRQFLAVANGKYPDQEWQARHRLIAIEPKK